MKHFRRITVRQAMSKDDDAAEMMFFQLYFTVLAIMLSAAFGGK